MLFIIINIIQIDASRIYFNSIIHIKAFDFYFSTSEQTLLIFCYNKYIIKQINITKL